MLRGVVRQALVVVCSMVLRCQLLSLGFDAGDARLDCLLHFLAKQEIERIEDLIGGPSLIGEYGAEGIAIEDMSFLEKVLVVALWPCSLVVLCACLCRLCVQLKLD